MRTPGLALCFTAALASTTVAGECRDDPRRVDQCFSVHGRIAIGANLRIHLWPVGTRRLLEISYPPDGREADPPMPENLRGLLDLRSAIFGDFELCPYSPDRPGRMRFVCVERAEHLRRVPY